MQLEGDSPDKNVVSLSSSDGNDKVVLSNSFPFKHYLVETLVSFRIGLISSNRRLCKVTIWSTFFFALAEYP